MSDVLVTSDPEEALKALRAGRQVELNQPKEVSILLAQLTKEVVEAANKGDTAPVINLANLTAKGTNLFMAGNLGIAREDMPQLSGVPAPGSPASKLLLPGQTQVSVLPQFLAFVRAKGIAVHTNVPESPQYLRPTQNQLDGARVAKFYNKIAKIENTPILVSRDLYIVDGHHHWAALIASSYQKHNHKLQMRVDIVDMKILKLLPLARQFAKDMGVQPKSVESLRLNRGLIPGLNWAS